jgi:hypothetical protein
MHKFIVSLATLALVSFAVSAYAASGDDVKKLVTHLTRTSQPKGVLLRKVYDDKDEVQVVFLSGGKRYSIFYSGAGFPLSEQWVSISVRPNGTSSRDVCDGFEDVGLDGLVDDGVLGLSPINEATNESRKYFTNDAHFKKERKTAKVVGEGFKPYWQSRYDMAIRDALKLYGEK